MGHHSHQEAHTSEPVVESRPGDQIHYREYKILLQSERFFSAGRFEEYWKAVKHIAKVVGVKVKENDDPFHRRVREVLFFDTEDFLLYNNAFILRQRTFYKDGWPERNHEMTVKFRHADREKAAAVDVLPRLEGERRIKFKEELLPLKDSLGGMRSLYSHNAVIVTPKVLLDQSFEHITSVIPGMAHIQVPSGTRLALVNSLAVEEVEVEPGYFDFGHGYQSKATIAVWRNRASETSLVGEFAFQAKFDRLEDVSLRARELSEIFFRAVQTHAPEWVLLGTTKTAKIYQMGGRGIHNHE